MVTAVLAACRDAALARGESADDADWLPTRETWVRTALGANATLRETPLIPVLLALLAGERDVERLPTARANVMKAVVDSLLVRRDANPDRLQVGHLVGDAAVTATAAVFATEARALVDGSGQRDLKDLQTLIAQELAEQWQLAAGPAAVAADAAIRFWDEHGIFVISGASERVTPRLPLFSEIGDAMAAVRHPAGLADWVSERAQQGAIESLILAAGLSVQAAEELAAAAIASRGHSLLHGAVRAYLDGAVFRPKRLGGLRTALLADIAAGGREGWTSLRRLLQLPVAAGTPKASIEAVIGGYPHEHRTIARAAVALRHDSPEDLRREPTVLLDALQTPRLGRLARRDGDDNRDWSDLAVDELYGDTIEAAAELLVGVVEEAADLVVARLRTVAMGTSQRLHGILEAAGLGERSLEATGESFRKTARLLATLDYDADDYKRFLEVLSVLAPPRHIELPERTKLDHLASFAETMWLNDAGSWLGSFRAHMAEVVELIVALGSFDPSLLAAESRIVSRRVSEFGGHEPFFSLFDGAARRELTNWSAVSRHEDDVTLLVEMLTWGLGSARLAASALWGAPVAEIAVPKLRALLPNLVSSAEHQRIAALTLCSLVDGPEPVSWLHDDDPILRAVCAAWLEPVGTDGKVSPHFRDLLADQDRNVLATAVRRLATVEAADRDELLCAIADGPEPGWTCLSCRTSNPSRSSSCGSPDCHRVPSHPTQDARQILEGTFKSDY